MLSAMTTSENFPLINQARCSPSPTYDPVVRPTTYVATILRQNIQVMAADDSDLLKYRLIREPEIDGDGKIGPTISYYCPADTRSDKSDSGFSGSDAGRLGFGDGDVIEEDGGCFEDYHEYRRGSENELAELLEELDLDDSMCEQSKPLKIDPNILKLDFGKITFPGDLAALEKMYLADATENKRASHHLSGGSLVTNASQGETNLRLGSGGGVLHFDSHNDISGLSNQVSLQTPVNFDLDFRNERNQRETWAGASPNLESTNPFRNSIDFVAETRVIDMAEEDKEILRNSFSTTNPFSSSCGSSSLAEGFSDSSSWPQYENVSLPQKSFSQSSTRPASPLLGGVQDESPSAVSNPFLINETSPEALPSSAPQIFPSSSLGITTIAEKHQMTIHSNSNSFIFAVPIFPFLQQNITNSSTQTMNSIANDEEVLKNLESRSSTASKSITPIYQNLTNQLGKFTKLHDHSKYDFECLKKTEKDLRTSGWYYENVSWQDSVILLRDAEPGTFLIRDSSDPNFLFSLSVQTSRGPTSVRLHYVSGQFLLDAEEKLIPHMPSFGSVIELIDYYVENTMKNKSVGKQKKGPQSSSGDKINIHKSRNQVWIDSQGNVYSNILLVKPLRRRDCFPSLQHLARLTVNTYLKKKFNSKVKLDFKVTPVYESSPFQDSSFQNNFDQFCPILSTDALPIPPKLIEYLQDYPYCH